MVSTGRISNRDKEIQNLWESNISRSLRVRKYWKELFRVDLAREFFDGRQNPGYPEDEWITINKIYAHLKSQLPILYSENPYFYVKLKQSYHPDPKMIQIYDEQGKIRQAYLNYLKNELRLKSKARLSIQDAMFMYGVVKVHYCTQEYKNPNVGQPLYDDEGNELLDGKGMTLLEPEYIPINERYVLSRIHPDDFVFGDDCGPLEDDWDWMAQRIVEPYDIIEKNKAFNPKAVRSLKEKGGGKKNEEEKFREDRKKGGDIKGPTERDVTKDKNKEITKPKLITRWEIYKLKEKKWLVIAEDAEMPLMEEQDLPPGVERHPYSVLRFTLRDDSPYPIPPVSQMIDPQKEYCLTRSRMVTHRKRFNRKYEVFEQGLGEDADLKISQLESGDDGTIIRKNVPEPVVTPIQDAPLDQQTTLQELLIMGKELIEVGGGSTDESRGIAGADSATQAGILDRRLEIKEGDSLSMVTDFVTEIARKLDQLVQANITKEEAVKIVGPEGEFWRIITPNDYKDIEGEFEYSVNTGSTVPQLPQMERSSWMAFLGLLSQFPHLMMSPRLMKKMAEMHHLEDEAMIEEIRQIGLKIMSGQMPFPGAAGSQPGVGETRPTSAVGGQTGGLQSLLQTGGAEG